MFIKVCYFWIADVCRNRWTGLSLVCIMYYCPIHYNDVIMTTIASQITSLRIVYSTVYSDADQRKHQSSASLAFVRGIHRGPVNSPHKWPVTRKIFPFDDIIMIIQTPPYVSLIRPCRAAFNGSCLKYNHKKCRRQEEILCEHCIRKRCSVLNNHYIILRPDFALISIILDVS